MTATKKPAKFRAGDRFVFRSPLLPMTMFEAWASGGDVDAARAYARALLDLPEVGEALFVASPSLAGALDVWREAPASAAGQRAEHSLVKYLARMMGRATPFGLFSGVSVGTLARDTRLALGARAQYQRRTRIDNDYLFVLVAELAARPEVRERLVFRPSTSLYRTAGRLRFAEARLAGTERSYHLVSVDPTPYLEATLARAANGATVAELAAPLVDDEVTIDDAHAYIGELIGSQLLVPDLGVYITGPEPIDGLLAQLERAGIVEPHRLLDAARARIGKIDAAGVGNSPERYREVAAELEALPAKVDPSRLFQVDMCKPVATATLSTKLVVDIANAVAKLASVRGSSSAFDAFKNAFRDRYDGRTVPLAEVLDEESGIGFESATNPGAIGGPLLAGMPFPGTPGEQRIAWSPIDHHMLRKLGSALGAGSDEIVLDDADFAAMESRTKTRVADAHGVVVRLAATPDELARGEAMVLVENAHGPSGARILGRFCHASPEIEAMVRTHHAAEEALRPDAVFAEIVHLNEGRIGNIVCRPVMRGHEIVFLGVSGAPHEQQILVDDLDVTITDRIVLTSRRLGKEVVPRMTTAHNYRFRSLGAYRFLCALANQDCDSAGWSWGALEAAPFLPRVRYGRCVLARAQWNLDKRDLDPITAAVRAHKKRKPGEPAKGPAIADAVRALRDARRLPRMFVIAEADNELVIDLDNPLLAAAFADEVSGADAVRIVELFPSPDRLVVTGPEGAFASELVLTFVRQPDETPPALRPTRRSTARRDFHPGSEWLYAKIYCGESTADRVLREVIAPIARDALATGRARQWFFLRYADPDPHVRIRFRGDPDQLPTVLRRLEAAVAPFVESRAVRKLVVDTYTRELERYGGDRGVELVEELFWRDSEAVLGIVELLDGDAGGIARWKLCVRGIDSMLDALGFPPEERAKICTEGKEMLGREMRADTALWTKIGDRFAAERADLDVMFARDPARDAEHDYQPAFDLLRERDAAIAPIAAELRRRDAAGELVPSVRGMAWSLVHMHANRLLHAAHRAQEMVLYDFVRRLHAAKRARG